MQSYREGRREGGGRSVVATLLACVACTAPPPAGSLDASSDATRAVGNSDALDNLESDAATEATSLDAGALLAETMERYDTLFAEQTARAAGDMYRMFYFGGFAGTAAPVLIRCLAGEHGVDLRVNVSTGGAWADWKAGRDFRRKLTDAEADEMAALAVDLPPDAESDSAGDGYMDGHNLVVTQVRRGGVTSLMVRSPPTDARGLVHDPSENLLPFERRLLELGVRQVAGAKEATSFVRSATPYLVDRKRLLEEVLGEADLYENEKLANLDLAARTSDARLVLRAGLDHAPLVVEGTVTEAKVAACDRWSATVRVDRVLVGQLGYPEIAIVHPGLASVVDSDVFRYHVNFEQGRRYVFFLDKASAPTDACRTPFCDSALTVPLRRATTKR